MQGGNIGPMPGGQQQQQSEGIEAWFAVEPAGAIALNLNFGMSAML
jgi:classical protein kinase C